MSFADLIKKGSLRQAATLTVATVATFRPPRPSSVASVASVGVATAKKQATNELASIRLTVQENFNKPQFAMVSELVSLAPEGLLKPVLPTAANDLERIPEQVVDDAVTSLVRRETEVRKQPLRSELRTETLVSTPAAAKLDPDRWCWPHSLAMTGLEIDTFAERASLFNWLGLLALDAERLADKLVNRDRDRDGDDRHLCVECRHCRPGLRCVKKLAVLHVLQRCDQFVPIHLS